MQHLSQAEFADRLRAVMEVLGVTGVSLAERGHFSTTSISRWRRPTYPDGPPGPKDQRRLEDALGLAEGALQLPDAAWAMLLKTLNSPSPLRVAEPSGSRYGSNVTAGSGASRDLGGVAAGGPDDVQMVGEAVATAMRELIARNEMGNSRTSRQELIQMLNLWVRDLRALGADVSDLLGAIDYIQALPE